MRYLVSNFQRIVSGQNSADQWRYKTLIVTHHQVWENDTVLTNKTAITRMSPWVMLLVVLITVLSATPSKCQSASDTDVKCDYGPCEACPDLVSIHCAKTGFRQTLTCKHTTDPQDNTTILYYQYCYPPSTTHFMSYFAFEGCMILGVVVSSVGMYLRKRTLMRQYTQQFSKQVSV